MKGRIDMVIIGLLLLFAGCMIYIKTGFIIALLGVMVVLGCLGAHITVLLANRSNRKRGDKG